MLVQVSFDLSLADKLCFLHVGIRLQLQQTRVILVSKSLKTTVFEEIGLVLKVINFHVKITGGYDYMANEEPKGNNQANGD